VPVRTVSRAPRLFYVDEFLSEREVMHLNSLSHPSQARARGLRTKEDYTGFSYEQPIEGDPTLEAIARRLEELLQITNEFGGTFRIRRYAEDQYHPPHTDTYTVDGRNVTLLATMLMYLQDTEEGGATHFPRALPEPARVYPKRGALGIWFSCDEAGADDRLSLHEGEPVLKGKKWTATYFVYNNPGVYCAKPSLKQWLPKDMWVW